MERTITISYTHPLVGRTTDVFTILEISKPATTEEVFLVRDSIGRKHIINRQKLQSSDVHFVLSPEPQKGFVAPLLNLFKKGNA